MSEHRLVHIVDEVPELESDGPGPVLVVALDGFLDAGSASALAVDQMTTAGQGRVVASFEVDELHDYRARRPAVTFHENRYTDYDTPRLNVRLLTDDADTPYLLLAGPEPDIRWEAFARAVREVVEKFRVRLVVHLGSVPMAVPHTRPVQLSNHATSDRLLTQTNLWRGEIRIPGSAQALLELRLGEWGHDSAGYVAHIPHYLAQAEFPDASLSLIEAVSELTGLTWSCAELRQAAEARRAEIDEQVTENAEVEEVVRGLEQQYDAFRAGQETSLLAEGEPLPSGEEIGAQFEQFLAGLDKPDEES